jgi:signal transduction histidine kinase
VSGAHPAHPEPPAASLRRLLTRDGNPLALAVGRAPARVRTKLLVALLGIAALLVLVSVLGLRVLGQSNSRAEELGSLQERVAAYQQLETQAIQTRELLALCAGGSDAAKFLHGGRTVAPATRTCLQTVDRTLVSSLALLGSATNLGFRPAQDETGSFLAVKRDYRRLRAVVAEITKSRASDLALHARAENLATNLEVAARNLASTTTDAGDALVAQNRGSYSSSRDLLIAVALGAVALALLLGFVLSRSLIGPIQRIDTRLAAIAAGDFSKHVDVKNRDELGALAVNLNRMNDELGRLYEELEAVSRHKSEFLANMSHELRTPLNAIIGFSEVLQQQMFGELNEQQLGYVDDVLDAGRHLLSLINDILDLAKVEAGRMELDLAEVSLPDVLRSGLTMQGERAARGGIALGLRAHPDDIVVQADERKLRQVVYNLLSNAVKFTPPGGRIDVSAEMSDGLIEVAVADTGSGIAPEDHDLIFEEFGQARGDSSDDHRGTGLGLPLSRKFIELHGGRLWVESRVGAGSTFRFTLPVRQAT